MIDLRVWQQFQERITSAELARLDELRAGHYPPCSMTAEILNRLRDSSKTVTCAMPESFSRAAVDMLRADAEDGYWDALPSPARGTVWYNHDSREEFCDVDLGGRPLRLCMTGEMVSGEIG